MSVIQNWEGKVLVDPDIFPGLVVTGKVVRSVVAKVDGLEPYPAIEEAGSVQD